MKIKVSGRVKRMLEELAKSGAYGATADEVASRFVEERLREFVAEPVFQVAHRAGGGETLVVRRRAH